MSDDIKVTCEKCKATYADHPYRNISSCPHCDHRNDLNKEEPPELKVSCSPGIELTEEQNLVARAIMSAAVDSEAATQTLLKSLGPGHSLQLFADGRILRVRKLQPDTCSKCSNDVEPDVDMCDVCREIYLCSRCLAPVDAPGDDTLCHGCQEQDAEIERDELDEGGGRLSAVTHSDFRGQKLEVGDDVAISRHDGAGLYPGKVLSFSAKMVRCSYQKYPESVYPTVDRPELRDWWSDMQCDPNNLCKLPPA